MSGLDPFPPKLPESKYDEHTEHIRCLIGNSISHAVFGDSILAHLELPLNILNAGIRGYLAEHIYWRIRDTSLPPAVVSTVILGGTNNISRWSKPRPKK